MTANNYLFLTWIILGLLGYNLGEQIDTSSDTEDILGAVSEDPDLLWTTMFMDIELQVIRNTYFL